MGNDLIKYMDYSVKPYIGVGPIKFGMSRNEVNGNSSDKKNMPDTIERVRKFRKQIKEGSELIWVCDSAAYGKDGILSKAKDWICRVPENIKEGRELLEKYDSGIGWVEYKNGYKVSKFESNYGDCEQRWLLVYSHQAFEREKKTFYKNLSKREENLKKEIWHLENDSFHSEEEAQKAVTRLNKKYKHHTIKIDPTNFVI